MNPPLLMEPETLAARIKEPRLLLLDVRPQHEYAQGHIPRAVQVAPQDLVSKQAPAVGKLPPVERLQGLFSALGLRSDDLVVAYDNEGGGWAGRMIWTLDMIGHPTSAYLNGGLQAWRDGDLPLSKEAPATREPSGLRLELQVQYRIELAELQERFRQLVVWDARHLSEYTGDKRAAARGGHIPGAIHLEWLELIDRQRQCRLRQDTAEYLAQRGLHKDAEIVTHCHSHHRSALAYLAARLIGYQNIRAYDGSWSEWGNRTDTPVVTGAEQG